MKGYGYYGHPYGLGYYGYGHYGKRSAEPSRHPQPKSVAPYLHYDLGRKLGYFAYRGYPQVWTNQPGPGCQARGETHATYLSL